MSLDTEAPFVSAHGSELWTCRVLGERDNHYTTETAKCASVKNVTSCERRRPKALRATQNASRKSSGNTEVFLVGDNIQLMWF